MPKTEHPLDALKDFLPANSFEKATEYLQQFKVHLTITKERQSVLGDYRNAVKDKNHRITINGNLNKYSFLITLLHELAHLLAFEKYGHTILAHGKEWKFIYSSLLKDFTNRNIFPPDVEQALKTSIQKPAASSCAEEDLTRVLHNYDKKSTNTILLEQLAEGSFFATKDGKIFQKGKRLRKRFKCTEKSSGLLYLFNPLYEVKPINEDVIK